MSLSPSLLSCGSPPHRPPPPSLPSLGYNHRYLPCSTVPCATECLPLALSHRRNPATSFPPSPSTHLLVPLRSILGFNGVNRAAHAAPLDAIHDGDRGCCELEVVRNRTALYARQSANGSRRLDDVPPLPSSVPLIRIGCIAYIAYLNVSQ